MESKIEKLERVKPMALMGMMGEVAPQWVAKELNRIIDHLNSQDQPEEEEWEKGLEDIVRQWNNGEYVGTLPHTELYDFISQELDKAREEGLKDGVKGVWDMIPEKRRIASILSKSITPVERSTEMTKFIGRLEGLSKLKDNK